MELLISYNRKPFSVAKIPYEDSHQVCVISHVTCLYVIVYSLVVHCLFVLLDQPLNISGCKVCILGQSFCT